MKTKQLVGLAGCGLMFLGVFMPIVSAPIIGNVNYFHNGKGDGVFVVILALASLACILREKYRRLWFTGIGSLGLMVFTIINLEIRIGRAKAQISKELADNPFGGLVGLAAESMQLQWGWAVLIMGAGLVIASAAMDRHERMLTIPRLSDA